MEALLLPRSKKLPEDSSGANTSSHSVARHTRLTRPAVTALDDLNRAVWGARFLFIVCLLCVAAILGFISNHYLTKAETDLAETQFESIADRALTEAKRRAQQQGLAAITMASTVSEMFPDAATWPFVAVAGFVRIAANLMSTSANLNMGFAPMVLPEQLAEWEDFIYDFYENGRKPLFPKGTIINPFGKGVWGSDDPLGRPENRYHDTGLSTSYGSPNQILFPVSHVGAEEFNHFLLANMHTERFRGLAIDTIIECSVKRAAANSDALSSETCGVITSVLVNPLAPTRGPSAGIVQPIYAANQPNMLVGVIGMSIVWDQIFENVFPKKVSGIDCVLENDQGEIFTYSVTEGAALMIGKGDLHQTKYDRFRRHIEVAGHGVYTASSPIYTLSLYPNDQLYKVYSTNNPFAATLGAVCIIAFTSLLFFLYDFLVRRAFLAKKELLASKRKFMRFVSHEVRTPMNSVCMGISVIQNEIAASLGYKSASRLKEIAFECPGNTTVKAKKADCDKMEWFRLTEEVLRNAQSAVDVLNDLLNYDKIESGTMNLELTLVPIWELIETTMNEFKLPVIKKKLAFQLSFTYLTEGSQEDAVSKSSSSAQTVSQDMLDLKVVGDTVRLTQVLRNVVSNALKFTPEEGRLTVRAICVRSAEEQRTRAGDTKQFLLKSGESVSLQQSGSLMVTIQDTGAGMTKDQLSKLFREGMQFNAAELQNGKGSGLGLCISKGIVELHYGNLEAASDGMGCGTTVTLTLPLYYAPSPEAKPEKKDDASASVESTYLNVLVVDDSVSNRKLLGRLLTGAGHICDLAEDGREAVEMVLKKMKSGEQYDSVLLDFEMPVMNGPDAASEMRMAGSKVYIVGLTGNLLPEDVSYFLSCGANSVLPKPLNMADLNELWMQHGVVGGVTASSPMSGVSYNS